MRRWRKRPAPRASTSCRRTTGCASAFGPSHVIEYFEAIAETGLDLVAHVYPAWTRASYSSATLAQLAKLPYVQAFKVGQRDMNKYAADIKAIRDANPSKVILTCHDEYLLATMVQGVDGALVGFATFIPSLINDLWEAVKAGDLKRAMKIQDVITPLKDAVYGGGEPTGEAHARMKMGMYLAGVLDAPTVRPPTEAPSEQEMAALRGAVGQRRTAASAEAYQTRNIHESQAFHPRGPGGLPRQRRHGRTRRQTIRTRPSP